MAEQLAVPLEAVEAALLRVQELEPPGVGARDLPESLMIQLRLAGDKTTPWPRSIVAGAFRGVQAEAVPGDRARAEGHADRTSKTPDGTSRGLNPAARRPAGPGRCPVRRAGPGRREGGRPVRGLAVGWQRSPAAREPEVPGDPAARTRVRRRREREKAAAGEAQPGRERPASRARPLRKRRSRPNGPRTVTAPRRGAGRRK